MSVLPYVEKKRFVAWIAATIMLPLLFMASCSSDDSDDSTKKAKPNPYLAAELYAITHFDSSQSDSTPYGPERSISQVKLEDKPMVYGGPVNIITLASTDKNSMWAAGSDRVSYVQTGSGSFEVQAVFQALANATDNAFPVIADEDMLAFAQSSAKGMTVDQMDAELKTMMGANYALRFGNGIYSVVDKDNLLYANYGNALCVFTLIDPANPSAGITLKRILKDVINAIQGQDPAPPANARITSVCMTYDGYLILGFSNGVGIINRELETTSAKFYRFADNEFCSNSIAVDEKNGIYVASDRVMRKLVWTGSSISDSAADGAWSSPYDTSTQPPIIKVGIGTGSTPTLMGFGDNEDRLVVITDGAQRMKLVAFWRDDIPEGFEQKPGTASRRIADQIQVTCGFTDLPDWIQSEQSVVVSGRGAFVVNNIPQVVSPELQNQNKILQVSLMGPAYPTSYGAERFEWDRDADAWRSVWARSDVSSTSMVPIHSESAGLALVNGYTDQDGWEVTGLDWESGQTAYRAIFGQENFGNGAYA
ncbi:MAG: hypothetical protein EOM25_12920, partial [Deltaproteobacteria bacterium]|nr:hypothetical protein [Deltaproteobacteria bacterium]